MLSSWLFIWHHKSIGTMSLGCFATSYQPLTSLVLMTSIICDASQEFNLLPKPKWPKRFCVTNQFQKGVVGVSQWFPESIFKNSIFKTALFGKMCVFFRICSLPNDNHFLSNINWLNCLWSFKITYRSKSHTKHFGLERYRPRNRYTMCAIHPSFISFSNMKCLQQFTRSKNSSLG